MQANSEKYYTVCGIGLHLKINKTEPVTWKICIDAVLNDCCRFKLNTNAIEDACLRRCRCHLTSKCNDSKLAILNFNGTAIC